MAEVTKGVWPGKYQWGMQSQPEEERQGWERKGCGEEGKKRQRRPSRSISLAGYLSFPEQSLRWRFCLHVEVGQWWATVKGAYDFRQSPSLCPIPREALECTLCLRVCLLSGQACWVSVLLYQLIICLGPPQEGRKFLGLSSSCQQQAKVL